MYRRTIITAAPAALLATTVPALAADPDAGLIADCAEYHRQASICNAPASTQEESDAAYEALSAALRRIEVARPRTPAGHCAWLRTMVDSYQGAIIEDDVMHRMVAIAYSVHGITPPVA